MYFLKTLYISSIGRQVPSLSKHVQFGILCPGLCMPTIPKILPRLEHIFTEQFSYFMGQWSRPIWRYNWSHSIWIRHGFVTSPAFVPPTKVLIGSLHFPTTKRPFTRTTSFESLINLVTWAMIQVWNQATPSPSSPSISLRFLLLLFILPHCMTWFSTPYLFLLSPCTEPAKQKLNYYGWVKEYDGSGLCVCACARLCAH